MRLTKPLIMRLTKPLNVAPANERASEFEERLVDVGSPLVAHLQPPVAIDPRQRPLHYPPMPSQSLTRLDATPGNAWGDTLFLRAFLQRP